MVGSPVGNNGDGRCVMAVRWQCAIAPHSVDMLTLPFWSLIPSEVRDPAGA